MKNLLILLFVATALFTQACAQVDVPKKVKTAFSQKFPNAKNVEWEKESYTEWEAEFKLDKIKMSAAFDNDGKWLETETEIKTSDLPEEVKTTLNSEYKDYEIEEAEKVENPEGIFYEVELEKEEGDKEEEMEILFPKEGKVIKSETETEDSDEDE